MNWDGIKDAADFLQREWKDRTARNPRYSLRKYAQSLGLSPGELSEILSKKRKLSLKAVHKISQLLTLSPLDTERLFRLISDSPRKTLKTQQSVPNEMFHVISDWYCLALLSLSETKGFKFDIGYISKRLGISVVEAKWALEHLEKTNLITKKGSGYQVNADAVLSPDEISSEAVRKSHHQLLEKAKEALFDQPVEEREFGGVTFAVHPKQLPELKSELKIFMDKWMEKVAKKNSAEPTEVYHLETFLFRLSTPMKEAKK